MKNTLLTVLGISLCYYDAPAQRTIPHSSGYTSAHHKMADGTVSTDKLAETLINSLGNFNSGNRAGKTALHIMPVACKQQGITGNAPYTYAEYMQHLFGRLQPLPKPRRTTVKNSGWLL
jgi:hypothetical protein